MHPASGVTAKPLPPGPDVGEVFQHQDGTGRDRSEKLRGHVVIGPDAKPRPLPRALLQAAFRGLGAFALETALRSIIPSVGAVIGRGAQHPTIGEGGGNDDAAIDTDDRTCQGGLRDEHLSCEGEREPDAIVLSKGDLAAVDLPGSVMTQALVLAHLHLDTLAKRGQAHRSSVGPEAHRTDIVRNGKALGRRAGRFFAGLKTFSRRGHRSHRKPLDVTDELGREFVEAAQEEVNSVVEIHSAFDVRVIEGMASRIVVGRRDERLDLAEGFRLRGRGAHLDSNRPRQYHAHVGRRNVPACQAGPEPLLPALKGRRGFRGGDIR